MTGGRGPGGEVGPKRWRPPLWARLSVAAGAGMLVLSGATLVAAQAVIHEATSNIAQAPLLGGDAAAPARSGEDIRGPLNLLLATTTAARSTACPSS
jgi:hypothetical protein